LLTRQWGQLAAVRLVESVDTKHEFHATAGCHSTRSGDLDPGLVWYLARTENMSAKAIQRDGQFPIRSTRHVGNQFPTCVLARRERKSVRCGRSGLAVLLFRVKKWIGAFAAALGGLGTWCSPRHRRKLASSPRPGCDGWDSSESKLKKGQTRKVRRDFGGSEPGDGPCYSHGRRTHDREDGLPRPRLGLALDEAEFRRRHTGI